MSDRIPRFPSTDPAYTESLVNDWRSGTLDDDQRWYIGQLLELHHSRILGADPDFRRRRELRARRDAPQSTADGTAHSQDW